uniref:SLC26A/SulP transporter domain-containing protein n=1 Tax=Timema genevievae TaxID=629358 RepID=A0A7R9JWU0_TIMGE|nr:unnamed protein product [Timema genevievae]
MTSLVLTDSSQLTALKSDQTKLCQKTNYSSEPPSWISFISSLFRGDDKTMCSRSLLEKTIPATKWLREYYKKDIIHDVIAGLTVGLTAIPQGIAYAVVAGLQPQYGLYAAFMGPFTYVLLGSCKDITIGPTAILALMTKTFVTSHGPDFAVLLAFLSGCIIFLLGLFRMGFLVDFISMPVTVGFTSAAALTIASSQLKGLFGFGGSSNDFIGACINLVKHVHETRLWDSVLGVSTIIVLLLTKNLKDVYKGRNLSEMSAWQRVLNKTLWMICIARNAVVVVLGALAAYILDSRGQTPFKLTGKITEGLPPFAPPPFSTSFNGTNYTFVDMVQEMGTSVAVVPLISILESVAIAKSFYLSTMVESITDLRVFVAAKGKAVDATQEMIALGISNILGSFVRSMPVTGSFTRTAVNNASGVCTQLGGAITGLLILVALGFLTGTFYYIPKASLAGLIICAMFFMVEYEMINGNNVLLVRPENGLVFPAAEYIRDIIVRSCSQDDQLDVTIVVDGTHVFTVDATMAKNLQLLTVDLELRKQPVIFWNWRRTTEGTCCGLDPNMARYFRYGSTLHDLFRDSEQDVIINEQASQCLIAEESES